MHGWIILDKPLGLGSTQGVSAVKRALRNGGYGKFKTGHGGTLDPLATGVLPIAIGEATKLAGRMLDSDKIYDFTIRFGVETDTLDLEGAEIARSDVRPSLAEVEAILPRFTGPIEQVPPAYSALKVDGQRAYDLARAGEEVALASRSVVIHALSSSPGRGGGPFASSGEWWRGLERGYVASLQAPPPPSAVPPRSGQDYERNGAANSGRTRSNRPVSRSSNAQVDTASTFTLPSAPVNRTCRSNRAPRGGSGTQVSPVTVSPGPTLPR